MAFGKIEYNALGWPMCEVCGKYFVRVTSHVRQAHAISAREYKIKFGFDVKKGIISQQSRLKSREAALNNFETLINENLIQKGSSTRFTKESQGRTRKQVSEQTRIMLVERAKNSMTPEARKQRGRELGLSGKGNKKRWGK